MDDPRIKQLEKDIENELNTSKSRYAFVGFGRSTDTVTASGKVEEAGQTLMGGLVNLISAEATLKKLIEQYGSNPVEKSVQKILASAQANVNSANQYFSGLKDKQTKRLKKLSEDILTASNKSDLHTRYNNAFRKFKTRPAGKNYLKAKPASPTRTKTYKPGMERKENIIPQRKLSSILASKNRLGARTLTGLKK